MAAQQQQHDEGVRRRLCERRGPKGGLPSFDWTTMSEIDGTVAPAIVEVKKYWHDQFEDFGNQIDQVNEETYGEVMVARSTYLESLTSHPTWGQPA
jgi:hypothetical protein